MSHSLSRAQVQFLSLFLSSWSIINFIWLKSIDKEWEYLVKTDQIQINSIKPEHKFQIIHKITSQELLKQFPSKNKIIQSKFKITHPLTFKHLLISIHILPRPSNPIMCHSPALQPNTNQLLFILDYDWNNFQIKNYYLQYFMSGNLISEQGMRVYRYRIILKV